MAEKIARSGLFILVDIWMILLPTAGQVWFPENQNLIKYSWANLLQIM